MTKYSISELKTQEQESVLVWFVMFECQEAAAIVKARKGQEVGELFGGKEGFYEEERSNARRREVSIMEKKGKLARYIHSQSR